MSNNSFCERFNYEVGINKKKFNNYLSPHLSKHGEVLNSYRKKTTTKISKQ